MEVQKMSHLQIIKPGDLPLEDGLQLMIRLQAELNTKVYPKAFKNLRLRDLLPGSTPVQFTLEEREVLTKEYLLAIIRECSEALDMINSKFWKDTRKEVDIRELKFEFIDTQHFINSLYDIWQMDKNEVLGIFLAKYKENVRRHENGY